MEFRAVQNLSGRCGSIFSLLEALDSTRANKKNVETLLDSQIFHISPNFHRWAHGCLGSWAGIVFVCCSKPYWESPVQ